MLLPGKGRRLSIMAGAWKRYIRRSFVTMGSGTCFFNVHILVCVLIKLNGAGNPGKTNPRVE